MKKCPYCAEEIQDEAIVCRYCGRDLVPVVRPSPVVETETKSEPKPETAPRAQVSAWKQGAKASAVITVLYFINNAFIKPADGDRFQGSMILGLISTYLGWWLICTAVVWVWRNLTAERLTLIVLIGIAVFIVARLVSGNVEIPLFSPSSTSTPRSTPKPTPKPTRTPDAAATKRADANTVNGCVSSEQVDESFAGQTICIYGIVYDAKSTNIGDGQFRIYFSGNADAFFLLDVNYFYPDVKAGDCVSAKGEVETDGRQVPFINVKGDLRDCQ